MRHGYTRSWVSNHIAKLVREGYPANRAVAIAFNDARKAFRAKFPRKAFPAYLKESGPVRKNPVPETRKSKIRKAAQLYEDFSGHEAEEIGAVDFPSNPEIAIAIGEVEGIIYNTVRDGKLERYIHKFKKSARPMFAVSFNGKQLFLLGGDYDFTERGIVDRG